jgi:putative phosphoesterase
MSIIGVISDTHGLLRERAVTALHGADFIVHAGDVGTPEILEDLRAIAPVTAVRGNVDRGGWANALPKTEVLEAGSASIYVVHILEELDLKPEAAGMSAVVYGHSHVPKQEVKNGVLYFNPGSAGPRRFKLPVTVGRLIVDGRGVRGEIVEVG